MAQVPDYEEFQQLLKRMERLEKEYAELKSQVVVKEWLSREETMQVLDVSEATLWRMTKANTLTHRYQGKRPMYEIKGLKNYLTEQKIEAQAVNRRVLSVIYRAA